MTDVIDLGMNLQNVKFFKIWLKEKLYKVFLIKIVTINTVSQFCFESCWPF